MNATLVGITSHGYSVLALDACQPSPMLNHKGGEIAVDEDNKIMYAFGVFVACYGTESIMRACESYR